MSVFYLIQETSWRNTDTGPTTIHVASVLKGYIPNWVLELSCMHLAYSEYSVNWTDKAGVQAKFDQSFVHMFQVQNAIAVTGHPKSPLH